MRPSYDIVIVGHGLAGYLSALALSERDSSLSILLLGSPDIIPSCTSRSTATVTFCGYKKGTSVLSDIIVDGYSEVQQFVKGLTSGKEYVDCEHFFLSNPNNVHRYTGLKTSEVYGRTYFKGESLVFSWQHLSHWFQQNFAKKNVDIIYDVVVRLNDTSLETLDNKKIKFQKIILCTGASPSICKKEPSALTVTGSYWTAPLGESTAVDQIVSFGGGNILILPTLKKVILGGTSDTEESGLFENRSDLLKSHERIIDLFFRDTSIPPFDQGEIVTGRRLRLEKRIPIWRELSAHRYYIGGGYKNGFSTYFKLVPEMIDSLLRE